MKTRIGKIAQLPKLIRDELNQRLQNGKQGPDLLKWLNAIPETKALLAEKFAAVPISKQNLSEWRQGGYEEWSRHQERELRIQRLTEYGVSLKQYDAHCENDLFECSGRIALAELMADLDSLHEFSAEERSQRLHTLTFDLARLQNAYNRSRWAALAWYKWNDRFIGPEAYADDQYETSDPEIQNSSTGTDSHSAAPDDKLHGAGCPSAVAPAGTLQNSTTDENSESPAQTSIPNLPFPMKTPEIKPHQATSTNGDLPAVPASMALHVSEEPDDRVYLTRPCYHRKGCGCLCRTCHPEDGKYPYAEALQDSTEAKQRGVQIFWRGRTMINTAPTECNCPCDCKNKLPLPAPPTSPSIGLSGSKPKTLAETVQQNILTDFLRQVARRKSLYSHNQTNPADNIW
jgi:hypothetical protein